MEEENSLENGAQIYCIYFQNKEENYDFGKMKGKSFEILDEITKLGGTREVYNSDSLESLCKAFSKINEAIETNYRLHLDKLKH